MSEIRTKNIIISSYLDLHVAHIYIYKHYDKDASTITWRPSSIASVDLQLDQV